MPTVSVIIPAYNRAYVIGRALDSALAQTFTDQEIIVVDDGSTDGTGDFVAANYPQVKLLRQNNRGVSAARNAAIQQATGKYIAFLDTDDIWLPTKTDVQLQILTARPNLGLVATQRYFNRTNYPVPSVLNPKIQRIPFTTFLKRTKLSPSTVILPKKILDAVGGFDDSLTTSEDWDLWARIAYRYPIVRIKQSLVAVYEMENGLWRSRKRKYFNDAEVLSRWNPSRPDTYDTEHRLTPLIYQRYVITFTILRAARLVKHEGKDTAREFLRLVEEKIGLPRASRAIIRANLRLVGLDRIVFDK